MVCQSLWDSARAGSGKEEMPVGNFVKFPSLHLFPFPPFSSLPIVSFPCLEDPVPDPVESCDLSL